MQRRAVFLGREHELAELGAALEDASAGRGRFVLLVGEPGIGKTRLENETCDRATNAGFAVQWGRCWESGGAPAYWPWAEILTALSREARLSAETETLLGRLGRDAQILHLGRLGSKDVASFVASVAGDVPPATVASIFRATAGNPLFLDEVLRTMLASGDLLRVTGPSSLVLPFGVRDAIRQHLAHLPEADRPIIEVASVLGSEVRSPLLAAAAARPAADVEAVLARAVANGILIERGRHRYGFGHGLICEALYRDLPNSRRMELHARVAEALSVRRARATGRANWARIAPDAATVAPRSSPAVATWTPGAWNAGVAPASGRADRTAAG